MPHSPLWNLVLTALLVLCPAEVRAQIVLGAAEAVDGDSLSMTGARIRLFGIDAPEFRQTCQRETGSWDCGQDARQRLRDLVAGKQVRCEGRDTDRYGRMVAVCFADGLDLGRTLVEGGLATALPEFGADYVAVEARARQFRIGIWGTVFEAPAAYRAANPREAPSAQVPSQKQSPPRPQRVFRNDMGCAIKGNRNRRGQWIYHLPGMPYYEQTRPEELFCTEAQAQAAGYRRAVVRP